MFHLTSKNFEAETTRKDSPTVVMFYARWCGKCSMMKPIIEELEQKHQKNIRFLELDIEESEALAVKYGCDIVPTFVFFKNQKAVGFLQGIIEQDIFEERMKKMLYG